MFSSPADVFFVRSFASLRWHFEMETGYKKIFNVRLSRDGNKLTSSWGIGLKGGWQRGEWLQVDAVEPNSPAFADDRIRVGDFVVELNGQIALFMTLQEAFEKLAENGQHLDLVLER